MTTYSAITAGEIDADSPLTTSLATKWSNNVLAIIEGDSTAVSAGKQISNAAIASGAVKQGELNTSTGFVSHVGGSLVPYALPAGAYGFYPQLEFAEVNGDSAFSQIYYANYSWSTSPTCLISLGWSATLAVKAHQRYINSSPPFNLGDGDVPLFVFVHVVNGKYEGIYCADVPPWAYNGPTVITGKATADGPKMQRQKVFNKETGEVELIDVEVTNDLKNADMDLIPHPFAGATPQSSIVLLDPVSTLSLLDIHEAGGAIDDLLRNDYIRFNNTPLNRKTPAGVQAVDFSWRNTGKKPVGIPRP